ncbi:hypothetical protein BKH41_00560 [Helicobacter sp. 12S02232-10]|uniref:PQQ-like beta-propeller repeat protein n=1 Tax=Helicobacter sp. 12S02232-10 TaxID=1476197 RepID=UPI000BCDE42E|nr:PQQ-like beta-propeller repeat protein [Helicobacter sp. 12S02232-10]PAF49828.1 hypothetical protein BKH41_00560 [Helicobacter sp. 12S02232-10]
MKNNKNVYFILAAIIFFVGCSSKKYFEPPRIAGSIKFDHELKNKIDASNRFGAVLNNGTVIDADGITYLKINKKSVFLNETNDYYIIAQDCHNIELINKSTQKSIIIPTATCPLGASIKNDLLGIILADNSANIYDINTKNILFSQKGTSSLAINSLVAAPVFLDTLVVFPTLDGRLLVVDVKNFVPVRNIIINSEKFFNNVTYLVADGENMFAATGKRLVSIISGQEFSYDGDIIDILYNGQYVYILTLEGQIIQMDKTLREVNKIKLPFASLNAIVIVGNKLYTIEKRGYLIEVDTVNFNYKVFEVKSSLGRMKLNKMNFYDKHRIYYDKYYLDFDKEH